MSTSLAEPFVLPEDVIITPVVQLSKSARAKLGDSETDFAVTRPHSRTTSSIVDPDSAALLERFRTSRTIVDAVMDFSRERGADPKVVLRGAYPVIERLIGAGLLLNSGRAMAQAIKASFAPGDRFADFEILRELTVVVDSELYQARALDGAVCALKIAREAGGARIIAMLDHEASVLAALQARAAPRLVKRGAVDSREYLAIEWREGINPLRAAPEFRAMAAAGRAQLQQLCIAIVDAYAELHAAGIVHGDVHDLNMLVDRCGAVNVIDYGLARNLAAATSPGRAGIFQYFDPELAAAKLEHRAAAPATPASDQYGVGVLLYQMLTGEHYIELSIREELALRQIGSEPPLSFVAREAPAWPDVERVLSRMLAKRPEDRYETMDAVARELSSIAALSAGAMPSAAIPAASRRVRGIRRLFERVGVDTPLYTTGLPGTESPQCSVNYGAAGIAYAWYRLSLLNQEAEALANAEAWGRRALGWSERPNAFYIRGEDLTRATIGRVSPYHTMSGVHCVRALTALAAGDSTTASSAMQGFVESTRARCENSDLTLGLAGVLNGCALLHAAAVAPNSGVRDLGRRTARTLSARLDRAGSPRDSTVIPARGIAHGWGGILYALLHWTQATGERLPESALSHLDAFVDCALVVGRGRSVAPYHDRNAAAYRGTWCNGDPGAVFLWLLAAEVLGDARFVDLAVQTGWNVWDDRIDAATHLCCGSAGRAYALNALYRATGDDLWLRRAQQQRDSAMATFDPESESAHCLYKGALGIALLSCELEEPMNARMPLFEPEGWKWSRQTV